VHYDPIPNPVGLIPSDFAENMRRNMDSKSGKYRPKVSNVLLTRPGAWVVQIGIHDLAVLRSDSAENIVQGTVVSHGHSQRLAFSVPRLECMLRHRAFQVCSFLVFRVVAKSVSR
jgi:hypothetical protein